MIKKKMYILIFISFISFALCCSNFTSNAKENLKEDKIYCDATLEDDFSDDSVMVVLKSSASQKLETLDISNFKEIDGKELHDLNKDSLKQKKVKNEKIKKENRVLNLKLKKKGKIEVLKAIRKLEKRDDVLYVGPDYIGEICSTNMNDTYYYLQYGINKMQFNDAWDITKGSSSINVGVIDSGIDATHPDLQNKVNESLSIAYVRNHNTNDYLPLTDEDGHGTHVAGIISANANNNIGIAGASPNVSLVSLKAFNEVGIGELSDVIAAINYADTNGIKILNLSARFTNSSPDLETAIQSYDGIIICAAGNDQVNIDQTAVYPASLNCDNIISVGNSNISDVKFDGSNYGMISVDLFATGVNILSTVPFSECDYENENSTCNYGEDDGFLPHADEVNEQGYHFGTGTSQAAPFVTAVAALLLSKYPDITMSQIKNTILSNVDVVSSLNGLCVTGGRLNAYKALSLQNHTHEYTICEALSVQHKLKCFCGTYIFENHSLDSTCTCTVCSGKLHNVTFSYLNKFSHSGSCTRCSTTVAERHMISSEDAGKTQAICLGCNTLLNLNRDVALINPLSLDEDYTIITENGSYIMSNGIIVLVPIDQQKYLNGELNFDY